MRRTVGAFRVMPIGRDAMLGAVSAASCWQMLCGRLSSIELIEGAIRSGIRHNRASASACIPPSPREHDEPHGHLTYPHASPLADASLEPARH